MSRGKRSQPLHLPTILPVRARCSNVSVCSNLLLSLGFSPYLIRAARQSGEIEVHFLTVWEASSRASSRVILRQRTGAGSSLVRCSPRVTSLPAVQLPPPGTETRSRRTMPSDSSVRGPSPVAIRSTVVRSEDLSEFPTDRIEVFR